MDFELSGDQLQAMNAVKDMNRQDLERMVLQGKEKMRREFDDFFFWARFPCYVIPEGTLNILRDRLYISNLDGKPLNEKRQKIQEALDGKLKDFDTLLDLWDLAHSDNGIIEKRIYATYNPGGEYEDSHEVKHRIR